MIIKMSPMKNTNKSKQTEERSSIMHGGKSFCGIFTIGQQFNKTNNRISFFLTCWKFLLLFVQLNRCR